MTVLLPKTLRLARQVNNESLKELAEHFNVSVEFLRDIERDGKSVPMKWIANYAEYFDLPVEHILLFEEETPTDTPLDNKVRIFIAKTILRFFEWKVKRDIKKGVFTGE